MGAEAADSHSGDLARPRQTRRISEIDTAKGIGIALVVFGHMVARDLKPAGNDWWLTWHDHLYTFHMAFFFFLSGYVFFREAPDQWGARLKKSAAKLLPAYALFALIVYAAKAIAIRILHVDRPVRELGAELLQMLLYPTEGFAQFLWFIITLLMIYVVMVAARSWVLRYYKISVAIAVGFHLLSVTGHVADLFALQQLARYTVFFLIAAACHRHAGVWRSMIGRYSVLCVALFVAVLCLLPESLLSTIAGLLGIPSLVALAVWAERWPGMRDLLQYLGRNTLTIYLMNSLAMGLVRAIVLRYWGWDGWHFFVVAPLLLLSGLFVPIAVQRLVFSRWNWSDRITR